MWTRRDIEDMYRRHGPAVHARCRRLLRDPVEAEDVAHDVFVTALQKPDAFRGASSPATWLFAVATHQSLNRLRNARARGAPWLDRLSAELDDAAPAPDRRHSARALLDRILSETDELTAAIALYHWIDGLPQGEIAALVGLSRVTVNKRIQALRATADRVGEEL